MIYLLRYGLLLVYTVFWGVIGLAIGLVERSGRGVLWVAKSWVGWIFASCGIRVEVEGLVENIDPAQPYVIMTNHQSVIDIGALIMTLPVEWGFVAKRELTWIPFFGWVLAIGGHVIIDRSNRERSVKSLRCAAERVRAGTNVIIFPEGPRSPSGTLASFKSGGFHLAIQARSPVLPATVSGSHRITPNHSLRLESGVVKIAYGKPIPTEGMGTEGREALKGAVRDAIEAGFDLTLQGARE